MGDIVSLGLSLRTVLPRRLAEPRKRGLVRGLHQSRGRPSIRPGGTLDDSQRAAVFHRLRPCDRHQRPGTETGRRGMPAGRPPCIARTWQGGAGLAVAFPQTGDRGMGSGRNCFIASAGCRPARHRSREAGDVRRERRGFACHGNAAKHLVEHLVGGPRGAWRLSRGRHRSRRPRHARDRGG